MSAKSWSAKISSTAIIDDEKAVRDHFIDAWQDDGYEYLSFCRGCDAVEYLSGGAPRPDLILSNIQTPGVSGMELLCALRKPSHGIPPVLASAGFERHLRCDYLGPPLSKGAGHSGRAP